MSDRIDFSPLTPSEKRLDQLTARITAKAFATKPKVHPVLADLRRFGAAVVVVSALLAGVAWVPALWPSRAPVKQQQTSLSAHALAEWAQSGEVPAEIDLLEETR